ncbi:MAG: CHAT domain-containing protein [Roseivirga sp.]
MRAILCTGFLLLLHLSAFADAIHNDTTFQTAERLLRGQQYGDAKILYQKYLNANPDFKPEETDVRFGLAESYFRLAQYDSAAIYFENALTEQRGIPRSANSRLLIYGRLGYIYRYITSDYRKALDQFRKELQLIESRDSLTDTRTRFANSYNLATTYRLLENYEKALNHGFSALAIVQEAPDDNQRSLLLSYSVIANILGDMKEFKRATGYHLKKIELSEEIYGAQHPELVNYYNNAALDFLSAQEYEEALKYFKKAQKSINGPQGNEYLLSISHRSISSIYQVRGDFINTKKHLDTALAYSSDSPFQLASTTSTLAGYYEELHQFDSALMMHQRALAYAIPGFKWKSLVDNPTEDQLFLDPFNYRLLKEKAQCWLEKYEFDGDINALSQANKDYQLMDKLTQTYRDNFTMESSKLFFQSWNYSNYENAIRTLYELHQNTKEEKHVNEAWRLIEMNKSVLLLENLMRAEKADLAGIPDTLKRLISKISEQIWRKRRDLTSCQQDEGCQESRLIEIRAEIRTAENSLDSCRQIVQRQSPDYYRLAYDKDLVSLESAQQMIGQDVIMLNYFATADDYYLISVSQEETLFYKIKRDSTLNDAVNDFLTEVSGETLQTQKIATGFNRFTKSSHLLASRLVPDESLSAGTKKLTIIPDGLLSLLPFEAFTASLPSASRVNFSALDYLIKSFQINYGYSATLWFRNGENGSLDRNARLLGFGTPSVTGSRNLANLSGTVKESEGLKVMSNAQVYIGPEALESTFKAKCPEADIIHLALHNANDVRNPLNSQLIFNKNSDQEDGALHLYELYGLQMRASLVVLSACATGVGDWQKGEGAYHMGRGFLYHGNPAMIISLWKIRDARVAGLMEKLYEDLSKGIDSDEALRNAKLQYINQSDEITAHPSNWASLVGIGKTHVKPKSSFIWYLLTSTGLLIIILIIRQFRVQNPKTT